MSYVLGIVLFFLCLFLLVALIAGSFIARAIHSFRKAMRQAADQRESRYREEVGRQRRQYSRRQQDVRPEEAGGASADEPQETIIDHRQRPDRKIFDADDDEYTEFEEIK